MPAQLPITTTELVGMDHSRSSHRSSTQRLIQSLCRHTICRRRQVFTALHLIIISAGTSHVANACDAKGGCTTATADHEAHCTKKRAHQTTSNSTNSFG